MRRSSIGVFLVGCLGAGAASTFPQLTASAQEAPDEQGVSQGSIVRSPQAELSEGPSPGYSQVIDNDTESRFDAPPGWSERSGIGQYGSSYAHTHGTADSAPARFKVEVPATGTYSVYARWPAKEENSATTRFGVSTTRGVEWTEVDQRTDGGFWGARRMKRLR